MKNFKCTLIEQGVHIQGDAQDLNGKDYPVSLLLSVEEENLPWEKAKEWANDKGESLPTRTQWLAIQEHKDEINEVLEKADKPTLSGWYWTCEEYKNNPQSAWLVSMGYGAVGYDRKYWCDIVRAVSAFPSEV